MDKDINERVFELIKKQFVKLMLNDEEYYSKYKVVLSNEQQFVMSEDREPNTIYIVVKFLPSSLIFGQYIQNITIDAVSEQNGIEVCKRLTNEYALTYNLKNEQQKAFEDGITRSYTIKQVYTSPMVSSNFNEIYSGFRSLFSMSGTFVISDTANPFDLYYEGEKIDCMSLSFDIHITPNTQPYFNSKNYTRSIGQYGTFSFNFTTYLTNTPLINKCLAIALKNTNLEYKGINSDFIFTLDFKNGYKDENDVFKLIEFQSQQNFGEMPIITLTFTN